MSSAAKDIFLPMFGNGLIGLIGSLEKARAHFDGRGIAHRLVLDARLYPDMFPLETQIRMASRHPLNLFRRLGIENVPQTDDEMADLDAALDQVRLSAQFCQELPPEELDARLDKPVEHTFRSGNTQAFTGATYLSEWVVPNYFFHLTTSYALLRSQGVEIGKKDFMGGRLPK